MEAPKSIKTLITEAFPKDPIMLQIARCESGTAQFKANGEVLRGMLNNKDVGLFMINEDYWLAEANRLGYNIYTIEGNIKMAKYILKTQGLNAWHWSSKCWLPKT